MAFNLTLPIAIGADHAGFECKEKLILNKTDNEIIKRKL
jgi:ribose 5-phosphate isomerase RpiB